MFTAIEVLSSAQLTSSKSSDLLPEYIVVILLTNIVELWINVTFWAGPVCLKKYLSAITRY